MSRVVTQPRHVPMPPAASRQMDALSRAVQTLSPVAPTGSDDSDSILAAITSGKALLGGSIFQIFKRIYVPDGMGAISDGGTAIIKCMTADAGLSYGSPTSNTPNRWTGTGGAYNSGYVVDGNNIATQPLFINCTEAIFDQVGCRNGTQDGVIVGGQNNVFVNLQSGGHGRANLVLDNGAGGNQFLKPELNFAGMYHLWIRSSPTAEGAGYGIPEYNFFHDGICEGGPFSGNGLLNSVYVTAGRFNKFTDMQFFVDKFAAGSSRSIVRIAGANTGETSPDSGYNVVGDVQFQDSTWINNDPGGSTYGIESDNRFSGVAEPFFAVLFPYYLQGKSTFEGLTAAHMVGTTTPGRVEGPVVYA